MTLSTTTNRIQYNGLTGQDTFAYNFKVNVKEDMSVYFDGVLQSDGDWTITGLTNPAGGDVILNSTLGADTVVTLIREVTFDQQTDYTPFDPFPAETHETALDDIVMMIQQLNERLDRVPGLPVESTVSNLSLGNPVASQLVRYNATADGLEASGSTAADLSTDGLWRELLPHTQPGDVGNWDYTWEDNDYDEIMVYLHEIEPVNDGQSFYMRLGFNDGVDFHESTLDYDSQERTWEGSPTWSAGSDTNQHRLLASTSNVSGESITGFIKISNMRGSDVGAAIRSELNYINSASNNFLYETISFLDDEPGAIDTVRLYFNSGNFKQTGTIRVIGLKSNA